MIGGIEMIDSNELYDFIAIKHLYSETREYERKKLIKALKEKNYIVNTKGCSGKGSTRYTSQGRMSEYDLSNWKYIETHKNDKEVRFLISFNPFESDKFTLNKHCLYDRIGICKYYKDHKTEKILNVDLPLDYNKIEIIISELENS